MKSSGCSADEIRRIRLLAKSRFQKRLERFMARDDAHLHLRLSRASVWAGRAMASDIGSVDVDSSGPVRGLHVALQSGQVVMRLRSGDVRTLVTATLDSGPGSPPNYPGNR